MASEQTGLLRNSKSRYQTVDIEEVGLPAYHRRSKLKNVKLVLGSILFLLLLCTATMMYITFSICLEGHRLH